MNNESLIDDTNINNANINNTNIKKVVQVSVAVIHYNQKFLLGYRHQQQHQGNRYEFVGGKIEANESAQQALIREVEEEVGIFLTPEQCELMGKIKHDYVDKQVCLHIFFVTLNEQQFNALKSKNTGEINQPLCWVTKVELLSGRYPLPEANQEILTWL